MVSLGPPVSPSGLVRLSANGRAGVIVRQIQGLCTWCGTRVPAGRQTWCGKRCVWLYRMTQPACLRDAVFARDHGVCSSCSVDSVALYRVIQRYAALHGVEKTARILTHLQRPSSVKVVQHLLDDRATVWDADHVRPISKGGKPFDLGNIRTLCYWCHKRATKELASKKPR